MLSRTSYRTPHHFEVQNTLVSCPFFPHNHGPLWRFPGLTALELLCSTALASKETWGALGEFLGGDGLGRLGSRVFGLDCPEKWEMMGMFFGAHSIWLFDLSIVKFWSSSQEMAHPPVLFSFKSINMEMFYGGICHCQLDLLDLGVLSSWIIRRSLLR